MSNLILLQSVGCVIDSSTLCTYPKLESGGFDLYEEEELKDHSNEWFNSLSKEDTDTINSLLKEHYYNITVKDLNVNF